MKFVMAQNEDGELRIASSSNNETLDDLGWYKIRSADDFKNVAKSEDITNPPVFRISNHNITQLVLPSWTDNREKTHSSTSYFLSNYNNIKPYIYTISEIFPISYDGLKVQEAYRLLTKLYNGIDRQEHLQYIDYSDTENTIKLVQQKPDIRIQYFTSIIIANNEFIDNLNNILMGQDLFFKIKILKQNSSTTNKYIQFDLKLYGYETSYDYENDTSEEKTGKELFSTRLFYITTNRNNMGYSSTINKLISISDVIVKYYKITQVIVTKNTSVTTDTNSYLESFDCYLPYFTWVNVPLQVKTISGYYLQNR